MDFMGFLFLILTIGYIGVNIWDRWEENERRSLMEAGRFLLPRFIFHPMIAAEPIEELPDAKFAIQHAGVARRCEVCHQPDCFDAGTGFCHRCSHVTL